MTKGIAAVFGTAVLASICLASAVCAEDLTPIPKLTSPVSEYVAVQPVQGGTDRDAYSGALMIYIVEPISRYKDYNNAPYEFGFLDWGTNQAIAINDLELFSETFTWNGTTAGFADVEPGNMMAIAVLSDSEPHQEYSNPPTGNPFWAFYTDGSAAATPGVPGQNVADLDYTHTVFLEEVTQRG